MTEFATRIERVRPSAIRELLALGDDPTITSFGGGYPDPTLFPMDDLRDVVDSLLTPANRLSLQYTASVGLPRLREQVAARLGADGIACTADDVLVVQGAQQGLDLAAKLFVDPGDTIVTEDPTFLGALIAFNPCEPTYAAVPMDEEGMDMDALEATLASTPRAKLVYTVPDFQNPTGVTMSLARRHRLIDLANRYDVIVVEDSPYRALRYDGASVPTIKSLDTQGRVVHLGSFSKILAPGMRLGWALASPEILDKLAPLKLAADTQCGTLTMAATSAYLERYDIDAHVEAMRAVYRHKRDVMLDALATAFPTDVTWTLPDGGLFTWVRFPAGVDAAAFMRDHALPQARVAYVPGGTFFPVRERAEFARFSFSSLSAEQIAAGVAALGAVYHQVYG